MFLLFLNLRAVPKKSTPGKLAYIRHFQQIFGINETKFEKMLIHFKSDVFTAVAVVNATKLPNTLSLRIEKQYLHKV